MTSVSFSGISSVNKEITFAAGTFSFGGWFKITTYPSDEREIIGTFGTSYIAFEIELDETPYFSLSGEADQVLTGLGVGYSGWFWVGITHVDSSTSWKIYYRKEGESTFSTINATKSGDLDLIDDWGIGYTSFGSNEGAVSIRSLFIREDELSSEQMLLASASLEPPSGTNLTFLPFSDYEAAGANLGTNGSWSVNSTPNNDPTEPDPSISPLTGIAVPTNFVFFTAN